MTFVQQACMEAWEPYEDLEIHQWAEKYVWLDRTANSQGRWRLENTPWALWSLRAFKDPMVKDMTTIAPTQTSKTAKALICLAWALKNKPRPMAWVTGDDALAKDASQERIGPTLERCKPVKEILLDTRMDNGIWKKRTVLSTLDISGAQSATVFMQNPYGAIFADECRDTVWPEGQLARIEGRLRTFPDGKQWKFSSAGRVGDALHKSFMSGNQLEWVFPCMGCGEWLPLVWSSKYSSLPEEWRTRGCLRWDETPETRPGGKWNIDALAPTIRYECLLCGHGHKDQVKIRAHIMDRGEYRPVNPNAPVEKWSEHWNCLLPGRIPNIKWSKMVDQFLSAMELAAIGNTGDLEVFVCESLAEWWEEGMQYERKGVITAGYRVADIGIEKIDERWKEWPFIFLTVDVQAYDFWHIVRGWKESGESRMLSRGRLSTWGDIRDKAKDFGLLDRKSRFVFLDSRYKPTEVRREAAMNGWTCVMGEDRRHYSHQGNQGVIHRIYSEPRLVDPAIGTAEAGGKPCVEFLFGDTAAQDLLQRQLDGLGPRFDIPEDVGDEYQKQIRNEVKVLRKNKTTGKEGWEWKRIGAQHLRDAEKIGVVAACMAGLLMEIQETK